MVVNKLLTTLQQGIPLRSSSSTTLALTFRIVAYFWGVAQTLQSRWDNVAELGDRRNDDIAVSLHIRSSLPLAPVLGRAIATEHRLQRRH